MIAAFNRFTAAYWASNDWYTHYLLKKAAGETGRSTLHYKARAVVVFDRALNMGIATCPTVAPGS